MTAYEFIYVLDDVGELGDPRVDAAEADLDVVFERHGDLCLATVTVEGSTACLAAVDGAHHLANAGFGVLRSYPDLVNRAEIAERLGCTRQAVGNWVRGERQSTTPFPAPIHLAAGGLWLWSDVVKWLAATGQADVSPELSFPSIGDHLWVDAFLAGLLPKPAPLYVVPRFSFTISLAEDTAASPTREPADCVAASPRRTGYRQMVPA
ncbi:hypothetical protein BOH72_23410 [Mycobacterium sp. WY10]|nr:hypothetical protein BOH72_23410 [Mycobacterium sp. WY10]